MYKHARELHERGKLAAQREGDKIQQTSVLAQTPGLSGNWRVGDCHLEKKDDSASASEKRVVSISRDGTELFAACGSPRPPSARVNQAAIHV